MNAWMSGGCGYVEGFQDTVWAEHWDGTDGSSVKNESGKDALVEIQLESGESPTVWTTETSPPFRSVERRGARKSVSALWIISAE